jgi:hypothetical protein
MTTGDSNSDGRRDPPHHRRNGNDEDIKITLKVDCTAAREGVKWANSCRPGIVRRRQELCLDLKPTPAKLDFAPLFQAIRALSGDVVPADERHRIRNSTLLEPSFCTAANAFALGIMIKVDAVEVPLAAAVGSATASQRDTERKTSIAPAGAGKSRTAAASFLKLASRCETSLPLTP